MNTEGRNIWQIGAGDTERKYDNICLDWGVMIMGPGELGPYESDNYSEYGDINNSLRRFYEAHRGDIVLLRLGTNKIVAVGTIEDDRPEWREAFADIDGWDLQHVRRVRWFKDTSNDNLPPRALGGQVRTFANVNVPAIREWISSVTLNESYGLPTLPECGKKLKIDDLGPELFTEGLPSEYVQKLVQTFSSIERVASWYSNKLKKPEGRPSEHETISYLVIPLLFALGWSEQTVAVEWRKIDVALFGEMPTNDSTLLCVIEAKSLWRSVFSHFDQALYYATRPERKNCKKIIVTDGIRYALHVKNNNLDDKFELSAYMNILAMRREYPILNCGGAVDAILGMSRYASNMNNAK